MAIPCYDRSWLTFAWVVIATFAVILAPLSTFAQRSRLPASTNALITSTNSTVSTISKTQIRR